jgi:hypothetical protein
MENNKNIDINITNTNTNINTNIKNGGINFLSIFGNTYINTSFTFGYDYSSDDFVEIIRDIFKKSEKKNKLSKYNIGLKSNKYDKVFNLEHNYTFDEEYKNFNDNIPDKIIDLYKLLNLHIDLTYKEIWEKFCLEEEKINLLNDIEKYVGYNILLNKQTRKIYDNYYLDYYIENWDRVSLYFSDGYNILSDKQSSNEILSQINFVYKNLFNSKTTLSDEKLNSDEIKSLINKYNKECEGFIIKHEPKEKTYEELEEIYDKMIKFNHESYKNNKFDPYKFNSKRLNDELDKYKAERNKIEQDIRLIDYSGSNVINKIILTYKEYKILSSELLEYYRYKKNKEHIKQADLNDTTASLNYYSFDNFDSNKGVCMIIDISNINLDNFDIGDFDLWRTSNNKLKEKITDSDYLDYLEERKTYNNQMEKKNNNNLDLIEFYFNQN